MRELTIKLYDIDELSDEAKNKAIETMRNEEDFFWEVQELANTIEKASEFFSFEIADYRIGLYDRNYIEIDSSKYMDLSNEDKNYLVAWLNDNIEIGSDGSCPFSGMYLDCFFFDYFIRYQIEVTYNNLHTEIKNALDYTLDKGVEALEEEYESDERYIEHANANEIEFSEGGEIYR